MKSTRTIFLLILLIFPLIQLPTVDAAPQHNSPYGACILLTFDDDIENMVDNVLPIMVEYGYRGSAFVPSSRIFNRRLDYVTTLIDSGWEMGSHSHEHLALSSLTYEEREYQLSRSRALFESVPEIGEVPTYTPPRLDGVYDPELREQMLMHYRYIRPATSSYKFKNVYGFWDPLGRTFSTTKVASAISKAEEGIAYAIQNNCPVWFMTHNVKPTSTGERVLSFDMFRTILDLVKASGLRVVIMRDLAGMSPHVNLAPSSPPEPSPDPSPTPIPSRSINELTAKGVIYWSADFETGGFSEVEGKGKLVHNPLGTEVSLTRSSVYRGSYAMQSEIVDPSTEVRNMGSTRAEFGRWGQTDESKRLYELQKAYWGCAIYLPPDFYLDPNNGWFTIFQLHVTGHYPDGRKAQAQFVTLHVENDHEAMKLTVGSGVKYPDGTRKTPRRLWAEQDAMDVPLGRWFTVLVYLDASTDGCVKLWIDGGLRGEWHGDFSSEGDLLGPSFQCGIYQSIDGWRGTVSLPNKVYYDNFVVASTYDKAIEFLR